MTKKTNTTTYVFKPMNTLTFWALLLIGLRLAGLLLYWLCYVGMIVTGQIINFKAPDGAITDSTLGVVTALTSVAYLATYLIAGMVTLVWLYGAARNARAIRPSLELTPRWAVGWYFIPIANLFKPYEVLRDIWITGKDKVNGSYRKASPRLAVWWLCNIGGSILTRIAARMGADMGMVPVVLTAISLSMLFVATSTYFFLVREIHRDQLRIDTRIVDHF